MLDRVLGGDDHERRGQGVGGAVHGDLALLHALEQRRLGLGRGPVDLVAEHEVGEHGPGPELEGAGAPVPHGAADDVGGEQVGGELDAAPRAVERGGQRLGQARLAHAGHVLDEEVALGDQAQHDQVDDVGLALDDPLDVVGDGAEDLGGARQRGGLRRRCRHPERVCRATARHTGGPLRRLVRSPYGFAHGHAAVPLHGRRPDDRPPTDPSGSRRPMTGDEVLAVDIGGTKLAAGRVSDGGRPRGPGLGRHPARATTPRCCSPPSSGSVEQVRSWGRAGLRRRHRRAR